MNDPPLSTIFDLPKMPIFVWYRYGISTDNNANPGFVAPGVKRSAFAAKAIGALTREYMNGGVAEFDDVPAPPGAIEIPGIDAGFIEVDQFTSVDEYVKLRKNLRKKMNAFRNKGGTVDITHGALSQQEREAIESLYDTMQHRALVPYQDIFARLVGNVATIDDPNMVHIVTRLNSDIVGYHSFYVGGRTLHCLSGGFDRTLKSTYHAYENLIIESVRYCLEHGLSLINYGPALNETKIKLMTSFQTFNIHIYPRYRLMRWPFAKLLNRSVFNTSDEIKRYRGLQGAQGTLTAATH
jgi:hypothetical protein